MKIYADLYKGYIKLYDKPISCTQGHDVKELEIDDTLASKTMYVGLSVATSEDIHGYGVQLSNDLDAIRAVREGTNAIAVDDQKTKTNPDVEYKIRNYEYYLRVTPAG